MRIGAGEIYDYVLALESERDELIERVNALQGEIDAHECPECEREHSEPTGDGPKG